MFKYQAQPYYGGCVISAIACALNKSWEKIENVLTEYSEKLNLDLNFEAVWGKYLLDNGFKLVNLPPKPGKPRMTVEELTSLCLDSTIIVAKCANHIVCIKNNCFFDTREEKKNFCVFHYYIKKLKEVHNNGLL
jgi:hypothetical protein